MVSVSGLQETRSKILFIDDEAAILTSLKRLLRQEAFDVVTTQSSDEAMNLFQSEEFAVVVSDQRMPEQNGTDVLETLQSLRPESIRILLTGYADANAAIDAINKGAVYRFLSKPWNDDDLRTTLRQAVSHYELAQENKRLQHLTEQQNAVLEEMNACLEQKVEERTQTIATLNQDLQKSLLASVQMMAGLSEMHSGVIGSHAKRVSTLTQQIASRMGVTGWELLQTVIAATLHDIGKIGLPPHILKPEHPLGAAEIEQLRQHPVKGESILLKMQNLQVAAKIVRHHHESFNGVGYPDRLAGEAIPLGSRIIAVVDTYDKLLNQKIHYTDETVKKALFVLKSQSGALFDPEVVCVLNQLIQEETDIESAVEIEIHPRELKAGMVLSRDLITVRNVLLLPKGKALDETQILRIQNFLESDPPKEGLYIYRTELPDEGKEGS